MDFELSDDQRALQEAARDLLDKQASPEQVRRHLASDERFDRALWRAMVDQGWMGVDLPEDRGGLGLGMVEAAVLLEQVGRHVAPAPFLQSMLALGALAAGGADDWVDPLLSGEAVGCVAWRSHPVVYAPAADVAVVLTDDAVVAVDLGEAGRPGPEPAMDQTRSLGWLEVDVAAARPLGGADAATRL